MRNDNLETTAVSQHEQRQQSQLQHSTDLTQYPPKHCALTSANHIRISTQPISYAAFWAK